MVTNFILRFSAANVEEKKSAMPYRRLYFIYASV